ncbi:hypothetical protein C8J57DRAFT_1721555 [Mycena rebaudengoi]|nr:hypothetical protein C8J57DRAFT_1721555 [Mycena rebaudengoi]
MSAVFHSHQHSRSNESYLRISTSPTAQLRGVDPNPSGGFPSDIVVRELFHIPQPDSVLDHLRQNILPSGQERLQIQQLLEKACARLATLTSSDDQAEAKAEAETYISDYLSLIAPISTISLEILSKILLHPDIHTMLELTRNKRSQAQRAVIRATPHAAAVSHYWRSLLLATPQFWASLSQGDTQGGQGYRKLLRLYLSRSRTSPLSLCLPSDSRANFAVNYEPLRSLVEHTECWMRLELDPAFVKRLIYDFDYAVRGLFAESWDILRSHLSNVVNLTVEIPRDSGPLPIRNVPPQPHPKIRVLRLNAGVHIGMDAFHHLNTPFASHLEISGATGWKLPPIQLFLERSACALQEVILNNVKVRVPELVAFFHLVPTLDSLTLTEMPGIAVSDVLFRSLLVIESQSALLPKLTQIILTGPYLGTTNSILTMLESRSLPHEHCSSLIAVKIGMKGRSLTPEEIARFTTFVEKLDGSDRNSKRRDRENGHIMQD